MQKAYGREMDAKLVMRGWELKFAGRYSVEQILYALDLYSDKHDDFPSPANIVSILEPEEPRVTEAQFIEAQAWQKRNKNWDQYTQAAETIRDYRRQNEERKEDFRISCNKVNTLAIECAKKMNMLSSDRSPVSGLEQVSATHVANKEEKPTEDEKIMADVDYKSDWSMEDWNKYVREAENQYKLAKDNPQFLDSDYWEKEVERRKKEVNNSGIYLGG